MIPENSIILLAFYVIHFYVHINAGLIRPALSIN